MRRIGLKIDRAALSVHQVAIDTVGLVGILDDRLAGLFFSVLPRRLRRQIVR